MYETEQVIKYMLSMQRYSWEQGVCAQELYEADREDLWLPMAYDMVKRQHEDGRLALIGSDVAVSDPASNGEVCFRAFRKTNNKLYLQGAQRMLAFLDKAAPRTEDGIICHNNTSFDDEYSPLQLWTDGIYMVPPFLACMGKVQEAYEQIKGYYFHLFDQNSGLFYHIVDTSSGKMIRPLHWATGNGWAMMGLARVIDFAIEQKEELIEKDLVSRINCLLKSMLDYQCPDGRFHDILDDPNTFIDGTSALMMAATVFRGIKNGYIPSTYKPAAELALRTVSDKIDTLGLIHEVCGCPHFLSEGTSAEAQASFIMAVSWRKKLLFPSA